MAAREIVLRATHQTAGVTLAVGHGDICCEQSDAIVNAANERLKHGGGVAGAISSAGGPAIQAESDAWRKQNGLCTTGIQAAVTSGGEMDCKKVIHVTGPVWSNCVGQELEVRGEITSWDGEGGTLMAAECGNVRFRFTQLAAGYNPSEGDRVRACISKRPPKPPGGKTKGPPTPANTYSTRFVCGTKFTALATDEALLEGAVSAALRKADEVGATSLAMPAISSGIFGFPLELCAQIQVKCALDFAASAKHLKRISFTNIDIPTVTAFVNEFRARFGAGCVLEDVSKGEAARVLTTAKGKELSGPMLIDVDSAGAVVSKQPCPPTTSTNMARIKSEGYAFHASGTFRNNWVRGMPPPGEEAAGRSFDPRGDWSKGNHGVSRGVPGMEEEAGGSGGAKKKKKKKKSKGGAAGDGGAEVEEEEEEEGEREVARTVGGASGGGGGGEGDAPTAEEMTKRLKAVNKKLRQAEELAKEQESGKELNVDQRSKVASVPEMRAEIDEITTKLAVMTSS